jgi:fibronectin type 3 domain-containing protein
VTLCAFVAFWFCLLPVNVSASAHTNRRFEPNQFSSWRTTDTPSELLLAQSSNKIKIAIFTFNILNLGAAGYDASVSNLFMTFLDQHRIFEVMNRKKMEESLRRMGLQQSENVPVVLKAGTKLGLDMVLFGNITKEGSTISFEAKLLEMARGDMLLSREETVFGDIALRRKVEEITREIVQIAGGYQAQLKVTREKAPAYPKPPAGLQARGGSQKITLSWNANVESNLRGYKVFRSGTSGGPFGKVASVNKNVFVDTGLDNNRTYYYKVQAFNQAGRESPASSVIAAETAPSPFSPIVLDGTSLIGGIRIRWTPDPRKSEKGTEVAGFKIYRAENPEAEYHAIASVAAKSDSKSSKLVRYEYEDSGLDDGSQHYYRIAAFNDRKIESDPSGVIEGKTVARPTGLKATGEMIREIHLQWDPSPFKEIKGHYIYRNIAPEGTFEQIGKVRGKDKTTYVDIDLKNMADATTYFYRITVFDSRGGESGVSEIASATTRGKPPIPEGLIAQSGQVKKVALTWKVRPEEEVEGYYLYWNTTAAGEFEEIAKVRGRNKTEYVDKGERNRRLDDDKTYIYEIRSYNKVDVRSDPSLQASATTKPRPEVPTGLKAQGGMPAKVVLSWNPNPETDIKRYRIWRQQAEKKIKEIKKVPADQNEYEDNGLDHGTTYSYQIQAEDEDKLISDLSAAAEASTKPLPTPPAGLKVSSIPHGFVLKWKSNPEPDIVTYKIYLQAFLTDKEIGSSDKTSFTIDNLDADKEYTVFVTAVDQDGLEGDKSDPVTVRTPAE